MPFFQKHRSREVTSKSFAQKALTIKFTASILPDTVLTK